MCGIVGFVGTVPARDRLMRGLERLEYRGYDSAGLALAQNGRLLVYKEQGRVAALQAAVPEELGGGTGIGHTRWATHGGVTRANAHPHTDATGRIAVVHNGILDNADALRRQLQAHGVEFQSQTDTEVLPPLIRRAYRGDPLAAVREALQHVRGTWGIAVVFAEHPDEIIVARHGSPLAVGLGDGWMRVGSDARALGTSVQRVVYLDDGELARVTPRTLQMVDLHGGAVSPRVQHLDHLLVDDDLGDHPHYMAKEILEQPTSLGRALEGRLRRGGVRLAALEELSLQHLTGVTFLACGTSYHASCVGAEAVERLARVPARAELASEFHSRDALVDPGRLYVAVSQSGETWDTLAAVRHAQRHGAPVAGMVNVVGSTIARDCGRGVYLHCGLEVAVASTKSFTSQVATMHLVALALARAHGRPLEVVEQALARMPDRVASSLRRLGPELGQGGSLAALVRRIDQAGYAFFMGRGPSAAVAAEGALKLRELSYVPCDAFAAGEMKHGPIAMLTDGTPVVAIVPHDRHREAMLANLAEVKARGAWVAAVHSAGDREVAALADLSLPVSPCRGELSSLVSVVPLQALAYGVALARGCDVDKPRNLAKSVTVA